MRPRRRFEWRFGQRRLSVGDRTLVAGMLNLAPEHHREGRDALDGDRAFAQSVEMEESGADLILISAEAWLAGARRIDEAEEIRRLTPALKRLRGKLSVPVGVATGMAGVAERAFDLEAEIIFDPSGLTFDPRLAKVVMERDGGFIAGHMRGNPEAWPKMPPWNEPIPGLLADLDASLGRARRAGVPPQSIVVDPSLGFGKRREQNIEILAHLELLEKLEVPLAVSTPELPAGPAATVAVMNGARVIRTPEVSTVRAAVDMADAVFLSALMRTERMERASAPDSGPARPERRRPAS